MIASVKWRITEYIKSNKRSFIVLTIFFIAGICLGAFMVNGLNQAQKEELMNYLQGFFVLIENQNIPSDQLFWLSLINYSKIYLLIWILGVTIIGIPLIYLSITLKGFLTGFSSGFIIASLGEKGILFEIIAFIPCEIIIIPGLLFLAVAAINFSMSIIKTKSPKGLYNFLWRKAIPIYLITGFSTWITCILAALLEAYIVPVLIRIILPVFA